ncbi:MAG: hypothetical protein BGO59_24435 [Spirosoma sp. 48-14]|nr:MAG: hypothetical protein BGO59_24435 [Spirosoma sp. 48-14]
MVLIKRLLACFMFMAILWLALSYLGLTCSTIILRNFIGDTWIYLSNHGLRLNWSRYFVTITSLLLFLTIETIAIIYSKSMGLFKL